MPVDFPLVSSAVDQANDVFYCRYSDHADRVALGIFDADDQPVLLTSSRRDQRALRREWCEIYDAVIAHTENGSQPFPDCGNGCAHHDPNCQHCAEPPEEPEEPEEPDIDPVPPIEDCEHTNLHVQILHVITGDPIEGVEVTVKGVGSQTTDATGWAKWRPIRPGNYEVTARKDMHSPDPAENDCVSVPAGQTTEIELPMQPYDFHLHVDANRDGTVDDDWTHNTPWEPGSGKFGAVVIFNNDNDDNDSGKVRDYLNTRVDGAQDVADLAPLNLRCHPQGVALPSTVEVVLRVSDNDKLRIFDDRAARARQIVGPSEIEHRFDASALNAEPDMPLAMEALQYPDASFDGVLQIEMEIFVNGASVRTESADVRVAPWIMFNHQNITELAYVTRTSDNFAMRREINTVLGNAGLPSLKMANESRYGGDRWMQDGMEPGYAQIPGADPVPATIRRIDRGAGIQNFPKGELLDKDYGFFESVSPTGTVSSLDSFGNVECSPPFFHSTDMIDYPFGRMIYGAPTDASASDAREMLPATVELFEAQVVQAPFPVNSDWLAVGHIDEVISFLPNSGGSHGWKVAIASPSRAWTVVNSLPDATPLFDGINVNRANPFGGQLRTQYPHRTCGAIKRDGTLAAEQILVQAIINNIRDDMKVALDLVDSDFIHFPILFTPYHDDTTRHVAYTPGSVNMLVVTESPSSLHLCIPKPFGPVVAGICQFEAEISANLLPLGHNYEFIDCFLSYHVGDGEIHCGTNSQRTPSDEKWWDMPWI